MSSSNCGRSNGHSSNSRNSNYSSSRWWSKLPFSVQTLTAGSPKFTAARSTFPSIIGRPLNEKCIVVGCGGCLHRRRTVSSNCCFWRQRTDIYKVFFRALRTSERSSSRAKDEAVVRRTLPLQCHAHSGDAGNGWQCAELRGRTCWLWFEYCSDLFFSIKMFYLVTLSDWQCLHAHQNNTCTA